MENDKIKSNIYLRVLSALFIGPVFIIAIMWVKPLFYLLMIMVAIGMLFEWYAITKASWKDLISGLIVIPIPIVSLLLLHLQTKSHWLLLLYFVIIWSVDTFAMVGGKAIGGPKLVKRLSPNKTWSGLFTGVIAASIISLLISKLPGFCVESRYLSSKTCLFVFSCALALIAQASDLFVSYFKRKFMIKDSGNIIPGHGGVLDRFDSIILTAPILFLISNYDYF